MNKPRKKTTAAGKPSRPSRARKTAGSPKKNGPGWLKKISIKSVLKWTATIAVWGVIVLGVITAYYAYDLPDINKALAPTRSPHITLLDKTGDKLDERGGLYGDPVTLDELSPALVQAILATEDRRFYHHLGIDLIGLARAMATNVMAGGIKQGGSTLTQQVAKNLFLSAERTLKRKVQELLLAFWLEYKFSKDQILTIYLNRVYLGAGTYGIEAASQKYFGKPARRLTLYQAATLAGLLKAPSRYNPLRHPDRSGQRTDQVLANMIDAGYLTKEDADYAKKKGLQLAPSTSVASGLAPHFTDWILDRARALAAGSEQDLIVRTTLDSKLQKLANNALKKIMASKGKRQKASEAALLSLSPEGAVLAMVGGTDYQKSQFNRATQATRQPGSAFKPFVYLAGLEKGLLPNDIFQDAPITVEGWSPANYTKKWLGPVTMRDALALSINSVAVRIGEKAGRKKTVELARRLGITSPINPVASLALGTEEVTLLDLTSSYGAFANGGYGVWAYGIERIEDRDGHVLYERSGAGPGRVIGNPSVAAMNSMLAAAVNNGTGKKAQIGRPVAGKTGTTQGYRDGWFIGYSANLITGVWVGNDDSSPMNKVTGGGLPAEIWAAYMKPAHQGRPITPLPGGNGQGFAEEPTQPTSGGFSQKFKKSFDSIFAGD